MSITDSTSIPLQPIVATDELPEINQQVNQADSSWDILSLGGRVITSVTDFTRDFSSGILDGVSEATQRLALPAISDVAASVQSKVRWTIATVQKGISSVDVVNMSLKVFNSTISILRDLPFDAAKDVFRNLYPLSEVTKLTSRVLNFAGPGRKIIDIIDIATQNGADNSIGEMPNFLKLISKVSLLASDVITSLRFFVDTKLLDAKHLSRDIVRFESNGFKMQVNLEEMQTAFSLTGFAFDLAENVRKIATEGRLRLGVAVGSLANITKIAGTVAGQISYSGMPVVSAVASIASSVFGIANFYLKEFELQDTVLV